MKPALRAITNFIADHDGEYVISDGIFGPDPYGAQCVCLVNEFCRFIGIEPFPGNAADFEFDNHPDCEWIPNTPENRPWHSDIVVWSAAGEPPYGHIAVCFHSTTNTLITFDQNWPEGSPCHKQGHNYSGIAGWLRPRKLHG